MYNIQVRELSKIYRVYRYPIHRLMEAVIRKPCHQVSHVLDDITFSILPKQSFGIVGDNGAGKTTLLKILAGTITPTQGRVDIEGRVSALLELGAGFHPEFTGRQNIHLNGSLMGMSKSEMRAKEDEIISFSGLEEYIDRAVKTYSSGMYIRLAFSIATSVDPDILIIDEALSVGDLTFQRKCIDRMNNFRAQGKTMVFCSHSMYHVQELCDKVLWLDNGKIRSLGPSDEVIAEYEEHSKSKKEKVEIKSSLPKLIDGTSDCRVRNLCILNGKGEKTTSIAPLSDITAIMDIEVTQDNFKPQFGFAFLRQDDSPYLVNMTHHDQFKCGVYKAGDLIRVTLKIKNFPLREGAYRFMGGVSEESGLLWYEYSSIWPVKIEVNPGLGLATAEREWGISFKA